MSVVSQIKHYQQSIEKCSNNESRLLHCIGKLYKLPVTVQHLQDTGVGRTVNALRKYEGTVGDASKALVAKWKTMVVDEESSDAEDDDDQNLPDVPDPYSDNSDLGIDKPPATEKPNKHRTHDSKRQDYHRHSDSRSKENSRSENEKKSSKSHEPKEKRDKDRERNDRDKSRPSKDKERHDSHKIHKSDPSRTPRDPPKPSPSPSKENKEQNGSHQNRKRKHESMVKKIPEKSESISEDNSEDDQILPQLSSSSSSPSPSPTIKSSSPPPKLETSSKDSKREKHRDKSRSHSHKSRAEKSDKKSDKSNSSSSRDHEASRHKSSKSDGSKERKSSESSSKSKHHKSKSPDKKKIKKHLNGDEGIDCNSGATFAEALGMCSAGPTIIRKKSAPVSPSSPVIKPKIEPSASTSKQKIKTEIPSKDDGLSLLAPNVKLEPLSVDLASTLPEISTNYKPLPVNNYLSTVHRKMEEDRVLNDAIYAKNMRTKVYSGNKSGYTSVPSLYDLCIRILIENIDALEATGGVPFDILKPVLEKATPDQLFMLEHHNPYMIEDTDSLWQFHCNREFRNKKREEMESFREMYMRCLDEREAKLKTLTANIKQSIDKSLPVRSAKLAFVDNVVKPPRNVLRKQARYGTSSATSTSDLKKKLITGSHAATNISVPPPPMSRVRSASGIVKKNKAPLMAKALQLIKGRYKR